MNLGSVPIVPGGDTLLNSTTAPGKPGSQAWSRDGRRFRLVKVALTTTVGTLMQSVAPNVGHLTMAPSADVAVGAKSIRVVAGSGAGTNAPANTYAGGLAIISTGPGVPWSYAVKGHEAIVATQPFTIVLESDESLVIALTAVASKVDLIANPYNGVLASTGTAAAAGPVGIMAGTVDAGNWGYVQVEGICAAVADGAIGAGQAVSPSVAVAGAVVINSTTLPVIGSAVEAGVAGRAFAISLQLP